MTEIYESTYADFCFGSWSKSLNTVKGRFWATEVPEVGRAAAFVVPGQDIAWIIFEENLIYIGKVASGLQVIIELILRDETGQPQLITVIGPKGRMQRIFEFIGVPIPKRKQHVENAIPKDELERLLTARNSPTETLGEFQEATGTSARGPVFVPTTVLGEYIEEYQTTVSSLGAPVETECPSCQVFATTTSVPWECGNCGAWVHGVGGAADPTIPS